MNLLIVAPEFPPGVGGMQVHSWNLAAHLGARGHTVTVVTLRAYRHQLYELKATIVALLGKRFGADLWRLRRLADTIQPDAILVLNAGYGIIGRFSPFPVVCRTVGNDVSDSWIGPHLPLRFVFWPLSERKRFAIARLWRQLDQRWRNAVTLWGLRACRHVLANSNFTARMLRQRELRQPQISVVMGGVDTTIFHPPTRSAAVPLTDTIPGPTVLITVAHLAAKKGIGTCIHALRLIVDRYPHLEYRVIGVGPERANLEAVVSRLSLEKHVRFLGQLEPIKIAENLRAAYVYVQSSRIETMGRAVCEANACGVPAVVTSAGGLPDVVRHEVTGLVVPVDDPPALADAIARLLKDPSLHERLAKYALAFATGQFAWPVVAARTERALMDACNKAPDPTMSWSYEHAP